MKYLIKPDFADWVGHDVHGLEGARRPVALQFRRVVLHDALVQDGKYECRRVKAIAHLIRNVDVWYTLSNERTHGALGWSDSGPFGRLFP